MLLSLSTGIRASIEGYNFCAASTSHVHNKLAAITPGRQGHRVSSVWLLDAVVVASAMVLRTSRACVRLSASLFVKRIWPTFSAQAPSLRHETLQVKVMGQCASNAGVVDEKELEIQSLR